MSMTKLPRAKRKYQRIKPCPPPPPPSPRVLQAAALRQEGLTFREIGRRLGVTHARAEQMVRRAGIRYARPTDEQVFASIRKAQASGLVQRSAIIAQVCAELKVSRTRAGQIVTHFAGHSRQRIAPPGTPEEWRWCVRCEAFAPPSSAYSNCPTHYNEYMRVASRAARQKVTP